MFLRRGVIAAGVAAIARSVSCLAQISKNPPSIVFLVINNKGCSPRLENVTPPRHKSISSAHESGSQVAILIDRIGIIGIFVWRTTGQNNGNVGWLHTTSLGSCLT